MKEQSYIIIAATFMMSLQLLALLISGNAQQMVIFVTPTNHQMLQCVNSTCFSFEDLFIFNQFESNTTLVMLPGTYIVGKNDSSIYVQNVENFSVVGWSLYENKTDSEAEFQIGDSSYTSIKCTNGTFAFVFQNVINLSISG